MSFPYGIMDPRELKSVRRKIKSKKNFYVVSNGETVQDNNYLSFTFGKDEFIIYRRNIRKGTGMYTSEEYNKWGAPTSKLPIEERWSARYFLPEDVFVGTDVNNGTLFHTDSFSNIESWSSYREYMQSDLCKDTKRPTKELFSYREFNRIAADID